MQHKQKDLSNTVDSRCQMIRRIDTPPLSHYSKYLLFTHNYAESYLKGRITHYYSTAFFFFKLKIILDFLKS